MSIVETMKLQKFSCEGQKYLLSLASSKLCLQISLKQVEISILRCKEIFRFQLYLAAILQTNLDFFDNILMHDICAVRGEQSYCRKE